MAQFTYRYPRPSVTVDLVVFGIEPGATRVLLVRRRNKPFAGRWAIPGGFVNMGEPFDAAARRELKEETGLDARSPIAFIGVFGTPRRDPRGRTISVAHATVVRSPLPRIQGGDDAAEAAWVALDEAEGLAFDHDEILAVARAWLDAGARSSGSTRYAFPFGE
jgi:8-oxo-dGTP diphosphatase